jgi:hypothetical protein
LLLRVVVVVLGRMPVAEMVVAWLQALVLITAAMLVARVALNQQATLWVWVALEPQMLAAVAAVIGLVVAVLLTQVAAVAHRSHQRAVMESSTHWLTQTMRQMVRFV